MRETISYRGVELDIEFDYTPAEPSSWEEPGSDEAADIIDVYVAADRKITALIPEEDILAMERVLLGDIEETRKESRYQGAINAYIELHEDRYRNRNAA